MKKIFLMIICCYLLFAASITAQEFTSGSGTESDPFIITTPEQLAQLATFVNSQGYYNDFYSNKFYKLGNDLDLSGYQTGEGWVPIGFKNCSFNGVFDGNNKIISGLYIKNTSNTKQEVGLFGYIKGIVKNLGVTDVNISSSIYLSSYVGAIVGYLDMSGSRSMLNCYSTGSIESSSSDNSSYAGGLVGYFEKGNSAGVCNCYSTCSVSSSGDIYSYAGGIAGYGGNISNCYSTGSVISSGWGSHSYAGGITGYNNNNGVNNTYVNNCVALNQKLNGNPIGRIVGGCYNNSIGYNNLAFSKINGIEWKDDIGLTLKNGSDKSIQDIKNDGSLGGHFTSDNGWTTQNGKLPGLFGNTVDIPEYSNITISAQPQSAVYAQNATATALRVTAFVTNGGTLEYQWFSNFFRNNTDGTRISGATNSYYIPPTATIGTIFYYVEVYNRFGNSVVIAESKKSEFVEVTVKAIENAQTPMFYWNPSSATYNQDATADALYVEAIVYDGGTLSYQWYWNATNSTTGGTAVGDNSASYIPTTAIVGTRYYYVVATNTNNNVFGTKTVTATSRTAEVTVNAIVNAQTPNITAQPQSITCAQGATENSLNVKASVTDDGMLSYQWYSNTANNNTGGSIISGVIGSQYFPPTTTIGTTYYYVVVTNTNNHTNGTKTAIATSNTAAVTVNTLVNAQTPIISVQPQPATYDQNATASQLTVTVSVTDGGTLNYEWWCNTENNNIDGYGMLGTNSAVYTPPTTQVGTFYYYVIVTNTNNSANGSKTATATSNPAAVTITVPAIGVTGVSFNKTNITLDIGSSVNLVPIFAPSNASNKNITWTSSNPAIATVNDDGTVIAVTVGTTVIIVTTQDGGKIATCTVTVTPQHVTSVEIADTPLARVYPNPTDDVVTLEFEISGEYLLTITDISGKVQHRQTANHQTVKLDLSNYPSGMYLLTIDDGKRQSTIRIVKN